MVIGSNPDYVLKFFSTLNEEWEPFEKSCYSEICEIHVNHGAGVFLSSLFLEKHKA